MEIASATTALAPVAFLACPVGMGLMMWMMARGKQSKQQTGGQPLQELSAEPASLEVLREEQRRLGDEIDRLEGRPTSSADAGSERQ